MNGGLILPGDISIYLRGLDLEECQTDEIEGKWTFPFPADYKFLGAKVGKKILRAFGFIFPTTMQFDDSCFFINFVIHFKDRRFLF